jgi:hypothetical protein
VNFRGVTACPFALARPRGTSSRSQHAQRRCQYCSSTPPSFPGRAPLSPLPFPINSTPGTYRSRFPTPLYPSHAAIQFPAPPCRCSFCLPPAAPVPTASSPAKAAIGCVSVPSRFPPPFPCGFTTASPESGWNRACPGRQWQEDLPAKIRFFIRV